MKDPQPGMKVDAKLNGTKVPAIVLTSRHSPKGNYKETTLLVAQKAELSEGWLVAKYEQSVQSYKLTKRHTTIPGLDIQVMKRGTSRA